MTNDSGMLEWALDRLKEHIGAVSDIEEAGRKGDQFAVGNGLAQLRHMLLANVMAIREHRDALVEAAPENEPVTCRYVP